MPEVFISYYTEERARADALAAALGKRGVSTFVDHHELLLGDNLDARISHHLRRSVAMVVLWSDHASPERRWVPREIALAGELGVRLIFVRLGNAPVDAGALFFDARERWSSSSAPPEDLVAMVSDVARPHVCVIAGYSGRALGFAEALAAHRFWGECEIRRLDPHRAPHWFMELAREDRGARAVVFVDLYDRAYDVADYLGAINEMRDRDRRKRRFKPVFVLIEDASEQRSGTVPAALSRYFRTPPTPTMSMMDGDWDRARREWDDKPQSSRSSQTVES